MENVTINIPYKIGADFDGGNWGTIYQIIEDELKDFNVVLWRLES